MRAIPLLGQMTWWEIAGLIILENTYFLVQAKSISGIYRGYGKKTDIKSLFGILVQATMYNELLPLSGMAGIAGILYWGVRLGYGLIESTMAIVWFTLFSYFAVVPYLIFSYFSMSGLPAHMKSLYDHAFFYLVICFIGFVIAYIFLRKRNISLSIFKQILEHSILKSYRNSIIGKQWLIGLQHPYSLGIAYLWIGSMYGIRIGLVELSAMALHVNLPLWVANDVYLWVLLITMVSILPTTLGIVEFTMTSSLHFFGISLSVALAITLVYRLITFWLPVPFGLILQLFWRKMHKDPRPDGTASEDASILI